MEQQVAAGIRADTASLIGLGSRARRISIDFRSGARSILAGAHISRFRGRGMDFAETREYQAGDDVRHIDWRVTARTGNVHTKLFVEERERPVFLIVDFSSSMFFGTRGGFKSVTAARAAAFVAWSVVASGDRVGGVVASYQQLIDQKPGSGRRGVLRLVNALAEATDPPDPGHAATQSHSLLNRSLNHAVRVVHPGSLVLVMSDFYGHDQETHRLMSRLSRHNDLVACQVLDPLERDLPLPGQYLISDGRNTTTMALGNKHNQASYRSLMDARQQQLQTFLIELGIPLVMLRNGEDITAALITAFGQVRKAAGKGTRR